MTLTESSIYISLKRLRTLLFQSQFDMPKGYRIVYGTPIMQNIGLALSSYVLAFTVTEQKVQYQAKSIIRKLSPKWGEFVRFNKHRVCIEALPDYTERNQIIKRYNLLRNGTNRKRGA